MFSLPLTHCVFPLTFFFPAWQSCARCHVAAMALAQRASVSVRRVGLAPRATREHAIHAARNMASATTGPASVSLAGRGNTATSVSCVCACVRVSERLIPEDIFLNTEREKKLVAVCPPLFSLRPPPTVTHDLDVVVKGIYFSLEFVTTSPTISEVTNKRARFSRHTFSDGCPGLCSGHGRCTLEQSGWRCVCQNGWSGPGCSVVMETDCSDGADNDGGDISTMIYHFLSLSLLSSLFHFRLSGRLSIILSFCFSCREICLIVCPRQSC